MTASHREALREQRIALGVRSARATLDRVCERLPRQCLDERLALDLCRDALAVLRALVVGGDGVLPLARKLAQGAGEFVGRLERESGERPMPLAMPRSGPGVDRS